MRVNARVKNAFSKALAILLALSMVLWQTPVGYAFGEGSNGGSALTGARTGLLGAGSTTPTSSDMNVSLNGDDMSFVLDRGMDDAIKFVFQTENGESVSIPDYYYLYASVNGSKGEIANKSFFNLQKLDGSNIEYNRTSTSHSWFNFYQKGVNEGIDTLGNLNASTDSLAGETITLQLLTSSYGLQWGPWSDNIAQGTVLKVGDRIGDNVISGITYTTKYGSRWNGDPEGHNEKTVTITLSEAPKYQYEVKAVDTAGNDVSSYPSTPLYLFAKARNANNQDVYFLSENPVTAWNGNIANMVFTDQNGSNSTELIYSVEPSDIAFVTANQNGQRPSINDAIGGYNGVTRYINNSELGPFKVNITQTNNVTQYRLVKQPGIDTELQVYDQDGETPHDMTAEELGGYKFYALALLVAKDADKNSTPVAWSITQVDPSNTGNHIEPISFTRFYAFGEDGGTTSTPVTYDSNVYDLGGARGVSIYKTRESVTTYKELIEKGDANPVDGFEWFGNDTLEINNGNTSTAIKLKKSYDKVLRVKLDFNDGGVPIEDAENLYLLIKVKHQNTTDSYFFKKIVTGADGVETDENGDIYISVPNWQDNNGSPQNDKYTGRENAVDVKLIKGQSGTNMNNAIAGTNCAVVAEGSIAVGYSVHYDFTEAANSAEVVSDDDAKKTYYTKVIDLTKVNVSNDYTFRSILGPAIGYGITADRLEQGGSDFQSNFQVNNYHDAGNGVNPNLSGNSAGAIAIGNFVDYQQRETGVITHTYALDELQEGSGNGKIALAEIEDSTYNGVPLIFYADSANRMKVPDNPRVSTIVTSADEVTENFVEPSISHMKGISAELASRTPNITPIQTTDKVTIDATAYPDGVTIYVDADALNDAYGTFKYDGEDKTQLNIKKKENQTIVFNFKQMNNVGLGEYIVETVDDEGKKVENLSGNSATSTANAAGSAGHQNSRSEYLCKTVVFNMASVSDRAIIDNVSGTFLLPQETSKTHIKTTSAGWIVSDG